MSRVSWLVWALVGLAGSSCSSGTSPSLELTAPAEVCMGGIATVEWTIDDLSSTTSVGLTAESGLEEISGAGMLYFAMDDTEQTGSATFLCAEAGTHEVVLHATAEAEDSTYRVEVTCRECDCSPSDECRLDADCPGGGTCDPMLCECSAPTMDGGMPDPDMSVPDPIFEHPACDGSPDVTGLTVPNAILEAAGIDHLFVANGYAGIQDKSVVVTMVESCSDDAGCTTSELRVDGPDPTATQYVDFRPPFGTVNRCADVLQAEFAFEDRDSASALWRLTSSGDAPTSPVEAQSVSNDARFGTADGDGNLMLHVLAPSASEGVVATETIDLGFAVTLFSAPFICDASATEPTRPGCLVLGTDSALVGDDTNGETDVYALADPAAGDFAPVRLLEDANAVDVTPGNGRFVVVRSRADLDGASPGLSNDHVFVLDRDASGDGTLDEAGDTAIERVSNNDDGGTVGFVASWGTISDDGRFVTYVSRPNRTTAGRVPADYTADNLFIFDRETDTLALVTQSSGGDPANGDVTGAQITPDGSAVFFVTSATNLDPDDTDAGGTVYIAPNPLAP
jgi:hypothetical protein